MFTFPNPVNEVVARTVAGFVLVTAIVYVTTSSFWVLVFLLSGFLVRLASGPRYSPTAWVAIHVIVPRLPFGDKPVAGPPKRFAQGIGIFVGIRVVCQWVSWGINSVCGLGVYFWILRGMSHIQSIDASSNYTGIHLY